jgi:hypothetical protein
VEEKGLAERLERYLTEYGGVYLAAPREAAWGDEKRIWTGTSPVRGTANRRRGGRRIGASRCARTAGHCATSSASGFETVLAEAAEWRPGAPVKRPLEDLLEKILSQLAELRLDAGN